MAPEIPIFLCDRMLLQLARWLRIAGYDAQIAPSGLPDRSLLALAAGEFRVFLSCNKKLEEHKAAKGVLVLLPNNNLEEAVQILGERLAISWLHRPFSRCLLCNTGLTEAPTEIPASAPSDIRNRERPLRYCAPCAKLYWPGTHTERMLTTLSRWEGVKHPGATPT